MKKLKFKRIVSVLMAAMMLLTMLGTSGMEASAASYEYPAQLVRISTYDGNRNVNISGYGDGSALNTWNTNGAQNENWRFDYVTNGVFKIVNQGTGMVLTPAGGSTSSGTQCVISADASKNYQYWYVSAVSTDSLGNGLYYKITNYANSSMALTYNSGTNTITLSSYSGSSTQKFLLNTAGLTGFAGYGKDMNGNTKASTIGGLLGETVYVDTFDELKAACSDSTPRTIVITSDISKTGSYTKDSNGRYRFNDAMIYIYPNKTIIGSYNGNSLYNVYFRTYEGNYGQGNNIIIRNIEISHDKELNNDNIWEFSYGWNFWIDHCTFAGHSSVNGASTGTDDWDKFLNFKGTTDYVTISDCKFGLHEYGVLLGYPTDTQESYNTYNGKPCVTLATNYYKDCITRAPGLMRYGYFHSLNNYVVNFDMGYTIYTAAKLYSEKNYYDGGTGKGSVVNDGTSTSDISYKYPGVYTDNGSTLVNSNYSLTASNAKACSWRPSSNYSYTAKSASDAKSYCTSYSGAQTSRSKMTYAAFASTGVPSASYLTTGSGSSSSGTGGIVDGGIYVIKNVNSGLCLDVAGGKAASGTNVQQWGYNGGSHQHWKLESQGDGYYKLVSQVGDGDTFVLDLAGGSTASGTNIQIWGDGGQSNQMFKLQDNGDGTYAILTKATSDKSGLDVESGSKSSGANVQQWGYSGGNHQKWTLEQVD